MSYRLIFRNCLNKRIEFYVQMQKNFGYIINFWILKKKSQKNDVFNKSKNVNLLRKKLFRLKVSNDRINAWNYVEFTPKNKKIKGRPWNRWWFKTFRFYHIERPSSAAYACVYCNQQKVLECPPSRNIRRINVRNEKQPNIIAMRRSNEYRSECTCLLYSGTAVSAARRWDAV